LLQHVDPVVAATRDNYHVSVKGNYKECHGEFCKPLNLCFKNIGDHLKTIIHRQGGRANGALLKDYDYEEYKRLLNGTVVPAVLTYQDGKHRMVMRPGDVRYHANMRVHRPEILEQR